MESSDEPKVQFLDEQVLTSDVTTSGASSARSEFEAVTATTSMTSIMTNTDRASTYDQSTEAVSKLVDAKDVADEISERESRVQASENVDDVDVDDLSEPEAERLAASYARMVNKGKPLGERVKKAPKQVLQIMQYTRLMEDRMQALESEVRELKNIKDEDGNKTNDSDESIAADRKLLPPRLIPATRRAAWSEYAAAPHTHAIEVLYGEPDDTLAHQSAADIWKKRKLSNQPTIQKVVTPLAYREVVAPFKPFVLCEDKIRAHTQTLIERLEKLEAEADTQDYPVTKTNLTSKMSGVDIPLMAENPSVRVEEEAKRSIGNSITDEATSQPEDGVKSATETFKQPSCMIPVVDGFDTRVLSGEEDLNPQDIACLMYACNLSRKQASSKLSEGEHDIFRAALTEAAKEEEKELWEKNAALFEARLLVQEWNAVISLLDNELASVIKVRKELKSGDREEVGFDDLAYMFEPGQYVVTSEDQSRMLRVFSVTGGRRLLNDKLKSDSEGNRDDLLTAEKAITNFRSLFQAEKYSPLAVDCYQFDFNGTFFGPVQTTFYIKKFDDIQNVRSQPVFPTNFLIKEDGLKSTLATRGKKFLELCSLDHVVHREYDGLSLDDPPEQIDSQVIVDFDMASRVAEPQQPKGSAWIPRLGLDSPTKTDEREMDPKNENCVFRDCIFCYAPVLNDQSDDQKRSKDFVLGTSLLKGPAIKAKDFCPEDMMLLSHRIFGFVLRSRKWARLHIDHISPVRRDEKNFERLVLPKGYRSLVRALVETHFKKPDMNAAEDARYNVDLVRGKGKGLIILLHGAPGVGKTSTAECVAEHTGRPLFPITCGDIGETANEVERNLDLCFQMAHRWGCVLLLDEADVFLAKRSKTDLRRNALVSVFLRVLEYYAGILFLTTNRVGTFDEAFKSRIHMSLWYPRLSEKSTKKVWQMNLDRTVEKKEELGLKVDERKILSFADDHWKTSNEEDSGFWNGRQIRNGMVPYSQAQTYADSKTTAFQTAIALAQWQLKEFKGESKEVVLNDKHFIKVSKASRDFDKYLNRTLGGSTEADRALDVGERADNWDDDDSEEREKKEIRKKKARRERERPTGINVADFSGSKKGKKGKKTRKEESSSGSESDESNPRKYKGRTEESESESDD
ncbi:P-loop containing nucleoside triphosphate hydrolase [Glarea lozoyensis ATCC 20868]|uniref:p-loop containing nucleoside triphosphate hydrolase n=1 Tax=Glarea lozoyensis (strain ATCC 20868 / MF5171) TaxID=1116229 RepID=S3CBY8_GLAL2|nr:P-loop containing nucleoside triphosphate hydrolase [Glarea lozoyensis ATCC 20868]EPE24107.1 P-loop containing nucleoside triphosphate hydrolase [Glarea lozoyensis ATCC 20868]